MVQSWRKLMEWFGLKESDSIRQSTISWLHFFDKAGSKAGNDMIVFIIFVVFFFIICSCQDSQEKRNQKKNGSKSSPDETKRQSEEPVQTSCPSPKSSVQSLQKPTIPSYTTPVRKRTICQINGHEVAFEDATHTYYVDGSRVPSVTDFVGRYARKYGWDDYGSVPPAVLARAAVRGTRLHNEIEGYERGDRPALGGSIELANYLAMKQRYGFHVREMEKMVLYCNGDGTPLYAGRFDLILDMPQGLTYLCDIKRTSKPYPSKVKLQLNLYRKAYEQSYGIHIDGICCIRLRESLHTFTKYELEDSVADRCIALYAQPDGKR